MPLFEPCEEMKARRTSDGHRRTIYLVMGGPVAAFTTHEMKAYLKRRLDTFANPLVYTFGAHQDPSIVTMSAAIAEG